MRSRHVTLMEYMVNAVKENQAMGCDSDKGDFMSRSLSLYCHSDTGPTGPTALILRD